MSFARRIINVTMTLGQPGASFAGTGGDSVELVGRRVSASISQGGSSMANAEVRVYGVPLDVMNSLTILGLASLTDVNQSNRVTVSAGTDQTGVAVVFTGNITECWVDATGSPDVCLVVIANDGATDALRPIPATSYNGNVDVATLIAGLAKQMVPRRGLENNGVSVVMANSYYPGTALDQIRAICRHANINFTLDPKNITVAIWSKNGSRNGQIPVISAETGMQGYPMHTQSGVSVTTLFDPGVSFGGQIDIESVFTSANGRWTVFTLDHMLESETPGGAWFTRITCNLAGR